MNNKTAIPSTTPLQKHSDMNLTTNKGSAGNNAQNQLYDVNLDDILSLEQQVEESQIPPDLKEKALKMIKRIKRMAQFGSYSSEFEIVEKYIEWIVSIPWNVHTDDNLELHHVKQILDKNHYGIGNIKDRLMEYLAVMQLHKQNQASADTTSTINVNNQGSDEISEKMMEFKSSSTGAPIICFVGLQGIGKTTMAKSIAEALGRKFVRISLGAIGSSYELRGRSRAFLDAEPGQIVKALVRTKVNNPLILLDEIDKVSGESGLRLDVMASLLEILDPEQNSTFIDHYVDYPVDLSKVMFIVTANNLGGLSTALLDRLEVIRFSSYTDEEKRRIAIDYLMPKVYQSTGLRGTQLQFQADVWPLIIRPFGFDAGVRQLERNLINIARKVARSIVDGSKKNVIITKENLKEYLPEDIGVLS